MIKRFVILLLALCAAPCVWADEQQQTTVYQAVPSRLPLPEIDAKAWALVEYQSGKLVMGLNAEAAYPPASITKLMTNYVIYEALQSGRVSLADEVSISEHAWRAEGSRMFAEVNSRVSLESLLKSTVIQSGNDAAIALAEHTAGSELGFAQLMNDAAHKLGLQQSGFLNSTGLPAEGHQMSALDIAKLSAAIIREHPDHYTWYAEKSFRHNDITQYNRNKLLWKDSSVDGLKTGHTEAAGFCLVGSALRNEQRWIAVVLGSTNERTREKAVLDLLNYGFAAYRPVTMLDAQGGLASARVFQGEVDQVLLQAEQAATLVVPAGRENEVQTELQLSPYYNAPIEVGQPMGIATLTLDGKVLADVPLVAMSTIKEGGWWKRLVDSIKFRFEDFDGDESD